MATFIPGMTDVFPSSGQFDPDFNRIERMLKLRESMYQQGAKKVKSLYDSIFSSTMLRDDNIEKRDAYLKTITESLNSVSALDFSLPQNQQIATSLFDPITTDKTILKDIAFTKGYMSELKSAESLRTSTDAAKRKMYWDVGRRALDYRAEEFKNADAQSALGISAPKYTPRVDIVELANKLYKDAGISVKQDKIQGNYIWTQKNGEVVLPITQSYVNNLFAQDPAIKEMFRTQAYVERKDFAKSNAGAYGGEDKAEAIYLSNVVRKLSKDAEEEVTGIESSVNVLRSKVESWDKVIKKRGIVPSFENEEYVAYLQDVSNLQKAEQSLKIMKDELIPLKDIQYDNIEDMRMAADNYVTMSNYKLLSTQIAKQLAYKNAELTVKVDPVSLAQLRNSLDFTKQSKLERIRHQNRLIEIAARGDDETTPGTKKGEIPLYNPNAVNNTLISPNTGSWRDQGGGWNLQQPASQTPTVNPDDEDEIETDGTFFND